MDVTNKIKEVLQRKTKVLALGLGLAATTIVGSLNAQAATKGSTPHKTTQTVNSNKANAKEMFAVINEILNNTPDVVREDGSVYRPREYMDSYAGPYRSDILKLKDANIYIEQYQDPAQWANGMEVVIPAGGEVYVTVEANGSSVEYCATNQGISRIDKVEKDGDVSFKYTPISAKEYRSLALSVAKAIKSDNRNMPGVVSSFCKKHSDIVMSPVSKGRNG